MASGYNSRTVEDIVLDTGVLKADITTPGTTEVIGVTRGGLRFIPGKTWRNVEFDGKRFKIMGLDRVTSGDPRITGTMLQIGPEDIRLFEPGSGGTGNTVTLKKAGEMLEEADYHKVELVFDRKNGGTFTITFPYAVFTEYEIGSTDANEGEVPITIEARQNRDDVGSSDGEVPYSFSYTDPA